MNAFIHDKIKSKKCDELLFATNAYRLYRKNIPKYLLNGKVHVDLVLYLKSYTKNIPARELDAKDFSSIISTECFDKLCWKLRDEKIDAIKCILQPIFFKEFNSKFG